MAAILALVLLLGAGGIIASGAVAQAADLTSAVGGTVDKTLDETAALPAADPVAEVIDSCDVGGTSGCDEVVVEAVAPVEEAVADAAAPEPEPAREETVAAATEEPSPSPEPEPNPVEELIPECSDNPSVEPILPPCPDPEPAPGGPEPEPTAGPQPSASPTPRPSASPTAQASPGPAATVGPTDPTVGTTRLSADGHLGVNGPVRARASVIVLRVGDVSVITGDGWLPGSVVNIHLFSTPVLLGTANVDANGAFSTTVRIPASIDPGLHTLTISGLDRTGTARRVSIPMTVLGTAGGSVMQPPQRPEGGVSRSSLSGDATAVQLPADEVPGPLAATGGGVTTLAWRAVLLLVAGLLALHASRRQAALGWLRA